MRRPARELREVLADDVWLGLGRGMAECLARIRVGIGRTDDGDPELVTVDTDALVAECVRTAMTAVGARAATASG